MSSRVRVQIINKRYGFKGRALVRCLFETYIDIPLTLSAHTIYTACKGKQSTEKASALRPRRVRIFDRPVCFRTPQLQKVWACCAPCAPEGCALPLIMLDPVAGTHSMLRAYWATPAMLTHLLHRPFGRREILAAKLHGPRCDTASMAFHRTMAGRICIGESDVARPCQAGYEGFSAAVVS